MAMVSVQPLLRCSKGEPRESGSGPPKSGTQGRKQAPCFEVAVHTKRREDQADAMQGRFASIGKRTTEVRNAFAHRWGFSPARQRATGVLSFRTYMPTRVSE